MTVPIEGGGAGAAERERAVSVFGPIGNFAGANANAGRAAYRVHTVFPGRQHFLPLPGIDVPPYPVYDVDK